MKNTNSFWNKAMLVILLLIFIISIVGCEVPPITEKNQVKHFTSLDEIKDYIETNRDSGANQFGGIMQATSLGASAKAMDGAVFESVTSAGESASDYSTTNIQVQGVDEADFMKNDDKYIYILSNGKLKIVDAYPAEDAEILSETQIEGNPSQLYLYEDKLVVIGSRNLEIHTQGRNNEVNSQGIAVDEYYPRYASLTFIDIYDVSDREDPELEDTVSIRGYYVNSRMIGEYVYPIVRESINYNNIELPELYQGNVVTEIPARDIAYVDYPDYSYAYTHIAAVNVDNGRVDDKVFLLGNSMNLFVSKQNIYLTHQKRVDPYYYQTTYLEKVIKETFPKAVAEELEEIMDSDKSESEKSREAMEEMNKHLQTLDEDERKQFEERVQEKMIDIQQEIMRKTEVTVIHRISIDEDEVEYEASGQVPGTVLNQFSMDEYDDNFRIATTAGHVSRMGSATSNNIYVLDEDLDIIGKLEDMAPGERIYSARFMGKKAYLVTFKKVDPLFVIDLENPKNPEVLGKLKIPGYSDYLHPYDEDHLIGIGKNTIEAEQGDFAWYQGVKVSLFDVSDVENPREIDYIEIGDRGSDSEALRDHKAVLFNKEKNLLVIPIRVHEVEERTEYESMSPSYGQFKWQGALALHISPEDGINVKAEIQHSENEENVYGRYYQNYGSAVRRSLYMDNVLYTVSDSLIKMNDMEDDFDEINSVHLN